MIGRLAFVLATAVLLAGCTDADWDHALSYAGLGGDQAKPAPADAPQSDAEAAPKSQAVAAAPDPWCDEVAKAAHAEAASQGFDAATQKNRAQASYQQCAHLPPAAGR
jgi:hypothetical protein